VDTPVDWALLPPGDAGLTRRVKAAGPSRTMTVKRGRKVFSLGVWAPIANIEAARRELEAERATPAYARKLEAAARRREHEQEGYVDDFRGAVARFLRFAPAFHAQAERLAAVVTEHATPVGSGTVARTKRIPIERRAEAAVIAWLRHATTGYDEMSIARVKGLRRETRRELAQESRALLDAHRRDVAHGVESCSLCAALARASAGEVK